MIGFIVGLVIGLSTGICALAALIKYKILRVPYW